MQPLDTLTPPAGASAVGQPVNGSPYEDLIVDSLHRTGNRTITESDLVGFVTQAGLVEPLFLDAGEPQNTPSRLLPGLLTLAVAEGLVFQSRLIHRVGVALLNLEVSMRAPVCVGDTVHVVVQVASIEPTRTGSRAKVATDNWVFNAGGEVVLVYRALRLVRGRDEAQSLR